jgi:hypothetical protein
MRLFGQMALSPSTHSDCGLGPDGGKWRHANRLEDPEHNQDEINRFPDRQFGICKSSLDIT